MQKELPQPIAHLAATSDDAQIVAAGADKLLQIWKLGEDPLRTIDAVSQVTALAAAPDDANRLFSGHADNAIRQWDLNKGQQLRQMDQGSAVTSLAVRGDGQQLASAGVNSLVKLWRATDGQPWPGVGNQPIPPMLGDPAARLAVGRLERLVAADTATVATLKRMRPTPMLWPSRRPKQSRPRKSPRGNARKNLEQKREAAKLPIEAKAGR